jgi:hypothetical protein
VVNAYHFDHIAGDTLKLTLTLSADGAPLNLSGATARTAIRREYKDPAYAVDPADAKVDVDATNGKVIVAVPGSKMQLPAGKYVYDVELTYQDGTVQTVLVGEITLYPDVSH